MTTRKRNAGQGLREAARMAYQQGGRRLVAPILGYPGLNLTHTTVKQNQFNHAVQYQTLAHLYEQFRPDAMMFLMDLSVEASALGLPVRFPLSETPTVEGHPIRGRGDVDAYRRMDVLADARVMVYLDVLRHMKASIPVPVGAYVTGPFTLAGLLMDANNLALNVALDPEFCLEVLEFATGVVTRYARALTDEGADFIVVLDPTAVMLGPSYYDPFAGTWARQLTGMLSDTEVILHICGDTTALLPAMAATGAVGLSLDSVVNFPAAAQTLGEDVLLMGNINPVRMVSETPETVAAETRALLEAMAPYPQFILSTGCDLPQETPLQNVKAFMDTGRRWAPVGGASVPALQQQTNSA